MRDAELKKCLNPTAGSGNGCHGNEYRVVSKGASRAIPPPPAVRASNKPCDAPDRKNMPRRTHHEREKRGTFLKNVRTTNKAMSAAKGSE